MTWGKWVGALALAVVLACGTASADILTTTDTFSVVVDGEGNVYEGDGSGYNNGAWYYYQNTDWWNQWFYDHPFDPERFKLIDVSFDIQMADFAPFWEAEVILNWSGPCWHNPDGSPTVAPPLPPLSPEWEDIWVRRSDPIFQMSQTDDLGVYHVEIIGFPIWDYNPEWVSIDIRGTNFMITNGVIVHSCIIPEPASLCLVGMALAGLAAHRIHGRRTR
ncbi:MAG: PEP-CTERM sorting domain-containing protein [bacterium]|nr:PEP-CTERM sorting domain-containing protein [bacterium]